MKTFLIILFVLILASLGLNVWNLSELSSIKNVIKSQDKYLSNTPTASHESIVSVEDENGRIHDEAKGHNEKGIQLYRESKEYERAIEEYTKAIKLVPNYAEFYSNRGNAYNKLKQYQKAMEDFNKVIDLQPKDTKVYNNRGVIYFKLKQYQKAINDYTKAISLDPNYAKAYYNLGLTYQRLKRYKLSIKVFDLAIESNPLYEHPKIEREVSIALLVTSISESVNGGELSSQHLTEKIGQSTPRKTGQDYALLIATDKYEGWEDLDNPINDAFTIESELKNNYGFITELIKNPSKNLIHTKLREYIMKVYSDNDQLLIFIAGHGDYDEIFKEGYIAASDSKLWEEDETRESYIPQSTLRDRVNLIPSKHILIVVDACFSGAFEPLLAKSRGRTSGDMYKGISKEEFIKRNLKHKTRKYITSGGIEYVPDGRPGKHSPFSRQFLEALRSNGDEDGILTLSELFIHLEKVEPEPRYGDFGDNEPGSNFMFISTN